MSDGHAILVNTLSTLFHCNLFFFFICVFNFKKVLKDEKSGKKLAISMQKYTRQDIPYFVSHLPTANFFLSVENFAPAFQLAVSSMNLI